MNRHDFLLLCFCVANLRNRIFTLEQIFVGKKFAVMFICENVFLRIAGKIAKTGRTRKNFVLHGKSCHACHTRFEVFSSSAVQLPTFEILKFSHDFEAFWSFFRGGTPGNSWWGCAARFSRLWPYFRPKNVIFKTLFQTGPLKSIPVFRPVL